MKKSFIALMLIFSLLLLLSTCAPLLLAITREFKPLYYTDGTPVMGTGLSLTLTVTQYPIGPTVPGKDLIFEIRMTNTGSVTLEVIYSFELKKRGGEVVWETPMYLGLPFRIAPGEERSFKIQLISVQEEGQYEGVASIWPKVSGATRKREVQGIEIKLTVKVQ
ncbi:MAG: hypothetical protein NUV70_07430 [Caldiserica bacterium]|nr:hypothetical protein [Caldisericota bacterium]